jgi:hypothetical protein
MRGQRMRRIFMLIGGVLVVTQCVRFARTNPPVASDLVAPVEIKALLRRACYDCHSNETEWSWYSAVAPTSWMVHHDVTEGRRRLNFSEWSEYASDPDTAAQKLSEIAKLVASGDMAPWHYRVLHRSARLTDAERSILARWAEDTSLDQSSSH